MGSSVTRTLRRPRYRSQPQLAGGHRRWIPPPSWRAVIRKINASSCHGPSLPGLRVGRRWEAFKPAYKASTALVAQPVRDLTVAHPACVETGSVGLRTVVSPRDAQDRRYLVWPDFPRPPTGCSRALGPASTSTLAVPCYPGLASFVVLSAFTANVLVAKRSPVRVYPTSRPGGAVAESSSTHRDICQGCG